MATVNQNQTLMCGDDNFGPAVQLCGSGLERGGFDFTLLFEQSILSVLPSACLLIAAVVRGVLLFPGPKKVKKGSSYNLKLLSISVFAMLQLTLVVLWAKSEIVKTKVSTAAASLNLLDALSLYILSHAEHTKSIQPSSIISVYLFFSALFDAVQCRTLWLIPAPQPIQGIFTASIAMKIAMLSLEVQEKGKLIIPRWATRSPEEISGVFSRGLFWWLNDMMMRGYKGMLHMDNLYATDSALDSATLLEKAQSEWSQAARKQTRALFWSTLKSLKWHVLAALAPRLAKTAFTYSQPFLINKVINYIGQPEAATDKNAGYGLIGATALIYIGIAISNGMYEHKAYRFVTACRGQLVSLIYAKTLYLSATATANVDTTAALSLMSTDVEGICMSLTTMHDLWSSFLEAGVAIYLLARQVGYACVMPIIVALGCTVATSYLSKWTPPARAAWNAAIQARVSDTSVILSHMKEVKLLGLTDRWLQDIQNLREAELVLSKKARQLNVWNNVVSNITAYITPVATFGVFILISNKTGQPFDVATALTSLSIISLLSNPMAELFNSWPRFAGGLGLFNRIQTFLISEPREVTIDITSGAQSTASNSDTHDDHIELQTLSAVAPSSKTTKSDIVLKLTDASYSLRRNELPILRNVNVAITRGSLTMIIGKVGSGKTTLLKGILQELPLAGGSFESSFVTSAYCDQQSWLINDTIQHNIIGESGFNSRWYETTVAACALDRDFAQLANGDQSVIGSKGLTLSGGQRQRVALARAVYARNDLVLIDDVLSGLDWATEEHIWSNIFGPHGLLGGSNATVVVATHAVRHIREADEILVMEDGVLSQQGNFHHLNLQKGYVQGLLVEDQAQKASAVDGGNGSVSEEMDQKPSAVSVPTVEQAFDLKRITGDTSLYTYYGKSIGWFYGISLLAVKLGWAFFEYFPQVWLRWWAEAEVREQGAHTGMYFGVYALFGVLAITFVGTAIWMMFVLIVPKSSQNLHWKLLKSVMGAKLSFFYTVDTGVTINRFSQDMSLIDQALPNALFGTIWGVISCVASLILVCAGSKYVAAGIPLMLAFMWVLQGFYLKTSRQLRFLDLEAKSPLYSHFAETISGIMTIRAFGWQNSFQATNLRLLDNSQKPYYLMYCIQRWLNLVLDLFVAALALLLVALAIQTKNSTSAGAIGVALLNVLTFSYNLTSLITAWTGLETSLGAIARLKDFEKETPQESEVETPVSPSLEWPEKGAISFEELRVSYSSTSSPVLQDVSFSIEAGQKVALCGRTGSGKSSLVLALFRLIDLDEGSTTIDGLDSSLLHRQLLRARLNAIPQDPVLFPGSVRFNAYPYLDTDGAPSDQTIDSALKKVGLCATVQAQGGLSASMSALALSHGQKQLFCLARAMLRRPRDGKQGPKVLVLDEATANVDAATEDLMMHVIKQEFEGYSILAVVHRLDSVLADFDRVAVLEKGNLVEFGEPNVLVKKDGGAFKGMWDSRK